jgi:tetratricopeptide (TPR) repeat protein
VRTRLALGRRALKAFDAAAARVHFEAALTSPRNLGEAKHLLANQSDIHYWLGAALDALGDRAAAERHWTAAATFKGDFREMRVREFSEMTYYSALSLRRLGREAESEKLLRGLELYADGLLRSEAQIDYFATSLPTMLIFEDDIQERQRVGATLLKALAKLGRGRKKEGLRLLDEVLRSDPNHAFAKDVRDEVGGGKR